MDRILVPKLLVFLDASPSPYHAVDGVKKRLAAVGFQQLQERSSWSLSRGGRYYFTRNGSALVAFAIGGKFVPN